MIPQRSVEALAALFAVTLGAYASPITYNVTRVIGSGTVTGTITTDGNTGVLTSADITGWNLTLFDGTNTFVLSGPPLDQVIVVGSDLTATSTQLLFDFSGSDGGLFGLQQGLFSGFHYYCASAVGNIDCLPGESVVPISVFQTGWQNVPRTGNLVIGQVPTTSAVPEPGSLALLGSGILTAFGVLRRRLA